MRSLSGRTVLIVDDEPLYREVLREEFEFTGASVIEAGSGQEALRQIKANPQIEVVVSDIKMPDGDGVFLLDELRKKHASKPAVILISGFSDLSIDQAFAKGAEGVFAKPCNIDTVVERIEKHLQDADLRYATSAAPQVSHKISLDFKNQDPVRMLSQIGRGGFSFRTSENIPNNSMIGFELQLARGETFSGTAVIRWVRRETNGESVYGCEWTSLSESARTRLKTKQTSDETIAHIPNKPLAAA